MITILTEEDLDFCKDAAMKRVEWNKQQGNSDIADYNKNLFNLTSAQANLLGLIVEVALCKVLDVDYTDPAKFVAFSKNYADFQKPDVLGKYESRRANKKSSPLPVRKKDLITPGTIIVQGYAHYKQDEKFGRITNYGKVEWNGWLEAGEAWELGTEPSWSKNGNSKVVELNLLKDMESLNDTLGTTREA